MDNSALPPKKTIKMVTKNMVQTTIRWPNGAVTTKTVDFCNAKDIRQFAKLAFACYAKNGSVECVGVNEFTPGDGSI